MRPTRALLALFITSITLLGCASSGPSAADPVGLTTAEEARLAELVARQEVAEANPDSALSPTEREEIARLRARRDGRGTSDSQSDAYTVVAVLGATVLAVFVLVAVSVSNDIP